MPRFCSPLRSVSTEKVFPRAGSSVSSARCDLRRSAARTQRLASHSVRLRLHGWTGMHVAVQGELIVIWGGGGGGGC